MGDEGNLTGEGRQCPVCAGNGRIKESYQYQVRHPHDIGGQPLEQFEVCWLCEGASGGRVTEQQQHAWEVFQGYAACPQCEGNGGKRSWVWEEGGERIFTLMPCRLCAGKRRVSPEQMQAHERERRALRLYGVGCSLLGFVVVVFGATYGLSLVVKGTPWLQCCPLPGFAIPAGIIWLGIQPKF